MIGVFDEDITSSEKLVLLAMADHADDAGKSCFPSITRIAHKSSMTRRGVQKVLRRLEDKGRIRAIGHRADGTVEYAITLQGGEPYSRGEHGSRRTRDAGGANQSAKQGEPCSPESSTTVIEPKTGAQAPNRPSPPLAFCGAHLRLTEKQDRLLGEAFPWVDRPSEYRKMDSWLEAHPERRIKKFSAFAHNWCARNSPKGGSYGHGKQSPSDLAIQNARTLGLDKPTN
jgi:hypothetical protein